MPPEGWGRSRIRSSSSGCSTTCNTCSRPSTPSFSSWRKVWPRPGCGWRHWAAAVRAAETCRVSVGAAGPRRCPGRMTPRPGRDHPGRDDRALPGRDGKPASMGYHLGAPPEPRPKALRDPRIDRFSRLGAPGSQSGRASIWRERGVRVCSAPADRRRTAPALPELIAADGLGSSSQAGRRFREQGVGMWHLPPQCPRWGDTA